MKSKRLPYEPFGDTKPTNFNQICENAFEFCNTDIVSSNEMICFEKLLKYFIALYKIEDYDNALKCLSYELLYQKFSTFDIGVTIYVLCDIV